ncbi:uroporphyrinogen-III C-methyltransferase, partial [Microbacterium sp. ISL-103]|uniref:SAM-dependent methyltransferase n=1 Tax=Microbacterium sp. ISL-103 TaxID=2819156 RepID=UPI001C14DF02
MRRALVGRVDLIGGGPGPADLLTIRAYRLLMAADVVVADRLGPFEELRRELPPHVEVVAVGKQPGNHPVPQHEIHRPTV